MRPDPAWVRALSARLDTAPAAPRAPLALAVLNTGEQALIGSIEATLARDLAGAGLRLRAGCDAWVIEVTSAAAIDPALASIAARLHDSGVARNWRGELLGVVDPQGTPLGAIERAAVRPLGIATQAVHLIMYEPRGGVWVQQRAFDKATDPGMWDTTMGGLSSASESSAQTLERETWEEAGLRLPQLHEVTVFGHLTVRRPVADGYMIEHIEMVEAIGVDGVVPCNQDGEVERFECIEQATLIERLHADAFTPEAAMVLVRWLEHRGFTGSERPR